MTPESGLSGGIEIADLYHEGRAKMVLVLDREPSSIDSELARRGVHFPDFTLDMLIQLGIPRDAVSRSDAGEGGTTGSTHAIVEWVLQRHEIRRAIVIVSPTHGRRYRRALRRIWPPELPAPIVRTTRYHPFRSENWWRSRGTLREGLVELQKLAVDYVAHPF
jgi:uncharacterized SAM-binding protein YcdF (DUF218 family)